MQNCVFTVHSAAVQPFNTVATLADGRKIDATVNGVVVELVSKDGTMTHTLKFIPDDLEAALATYPVNGEVTACYELTAPPPPVEDPEPAGEPAPAGDPPADPPTP